MANPNIEAGTTTLLVSKGLTNIGTSNVNFIDAVTTGHVYSLDSIMLANNSTACTVDAVVGVYDASDTVTLLLANSITLLAKSSLDIINKPIYLNENDKLFIRSSVVNGIDGIASWKDMS